MNNQNYRSERQLTDRQRGLAKLAKWEQRARQKGDKLPGHKRLVAALELARAWQHAKASGLRKEDFQERILVSLRRNHERREAFKLANYILPRSITEITPDIIRRYETKSEPLRGLEPYLVGIGIAAEQCGADPDDWKMDLISKLNLSEPAGGDGDMPEPDEERPFLNLTVLLQALCASVGRRSGVGRALAALGTPGNRYFARWDMFEERLYPFPTGCMAPFYSPISPVPESGVYLGEMLALPSVSLIRIPYLVGPASFALAPHDTQSNENPRDSAERFVRSGKLIFMREIRLASVPDGRGGFTGALESRPRLEVELFGDDELAGRHFVERARCPDFGVNFYDVRQSIIRTAPGKIFRIDHAEDCFLGQDFEALGYHCQPDPRDPEETTWHWAPDPVRDPHGGGSEPWYVSYTPVASDYLAYWLDQDWALDGVPAVCPWERSHLSIDDDLIPPPAELNFPYAGSPAWIECALHDGSLVNALDQAAGRIVSEVTQLIRDQDAARDHHVQNLCKRFQSNDHQGAPE